MPVSLKNVIVYMGMREVFVVFMVYRFYLFIPLS